MVIFVFMVEGNKKNDEITKQDLLNLLKESMNPSTPPSQETTAAATPPSFMNPAGSPQTTTTSTQEKRVIAQMMMKLHKNIIILCLMLFAIPVTTALISLIDPIIAICVPMIAIIYPAWLYTQSNKAQDYLSRKYNLQPFPAIRKQVPQKQRESDFI